MLKISKSKSIVLASMSIGASIVIVATLSIASPPITPVVDNSTSNTPLASSNNLNDAPQQSQVISPSKNNNTTPEPMVVPSLETKATKALRSDNTVITQDGTTYPLRVYKTMLTPNDPSYSQWWVGPNGMTNVWDIDASSSDVTIAVIDTGFALNHQEFSGRWAINSGESGVTILENPSDLNCTDQGLALNRNCNNIDDNYDGIVDNESGVTSQENPSDLNCTDQAITLDKSCNNRDDDGNGLVDDYRGYDFANLDASVQAGEINPTGSGTTHGTMVAGVLGATGNNGVGIAGVNWHAKILPLQALDDDGYGDSYTVGEAIYYAADQGVDIISMSLGTESTDPYLRTAILYALDRGVIIVAASGNDGCDCISYPANYPEVIAVGATNPSNQPASFSSYGSQLDILAPGQSMTAPTFTAINQTSAYTSGSGTSFATPFVSGMLGLAKALQPNATNEELIGALFEYSDRRTHTASSPRSNTLGFGVSMASNMLSRLQTPVTHLQRYQFSGGTITGSVRSYQCEGNTLPATRYYELKKSGVYRYSANLREVSKYEQQGWVSRTVAYTCIGLPNDSVDITRLINIPSETLNLKLKQ